MEAFSRIGTKSGKNKTYGLKWKLPKIVGTKSDFLPFFFFFFYGKEKMTRGDSQNHYCPVLPMHK